MSRAPARWAWIALIATLLLGIGWGAHAPDSWDVDNIAPGSVLRGMAARFGPGWYSSYGPIPYLVVAALYVPFLLIARWTGELGTPQPEYPWGFQHPDLSVGALILIARLVCVALALGLALLAARERWSRTSRDAWLPPLLLVGAPTFVFYARTSNVDMFWLFLLAVAFHFARGDASLRASAGAMMAAVAAVCCKEQSAPLAVVAAGAALLAVWHNGATAAERLRGLGLTVMAGVVTYVVVWGLPWNQSGWRDHHRFIFEQARYPRDFPATPAGVLGLARRAAELLPVTLGWPILVGAAFAIPFRTGIAGLGARATAVTLYALGFLATIGYVYPRFLLPTLLLGLPLATRGWSAALDQAGRHAPALIAVLVGLAAFGGPLLGVAQLGDTRVLAARWLRQHAPAGATVETVGNPRFLPRLPRAYATDSYSVDSLAAAPRPPRGDFVMLSAFDRYSIESDSALKRVWMDPLTGPGATYRMAADIPPPRWGRPLTGLPVSPVIWIWQRK